MTKWFAVALTAIAAAFLPAGAIGETAMATGGSTSNDIDIVRVEAAGSLSTNADINVFGTVRCTATGPVTIDAPLTQAPVGTGAGSNTQNRCLAGETIKWVVTVQGLQVTIDRNVTVTAIANGSANATTTEIQKLRWGLHVSSAEDD